MAEPIDIPFAATAGPAPPVAIPYASAATSGYRSPRPHAGRLIVALWVAAVLEFMMLWPTVGTVGALVLQQSSGREFHPLITGPAARIQVAMNIAFLTSLAFWATWVHRTYSNLVPLGATGLRYSPRWAVAYNFIPAVHMFRPFQVMRETWRASDPRHAGGESWRGTPSPALVNGWWAVYLLAVLAFVVTLLLDTEGYDRPRLIAAASTGTAVALLRATGFLIQIRVVKRVTAMQDERAERVASSNP